MGGYFQSYLHFLHNVVKISYLCQNLACWEIEYDAFFENREVVIRLYGYIHLLQEYL